MDSKSVPGFTFFPFSCPLLCTYKLCLLLFCPASCYLSFLFCFWQQGFEINRVLMLCLSFTCVRANNITDWLHRPISFGGWIHFILASDLHPNLSHILPLLEHYYYYFHVMHCDGVLKAFEARNMYFVQLYLTDLCASCNSPAFCAEGENETLNGQWLMWSSPVSSPQWLLRRL